MEMERVVAESGGKRSGYIPYRDSKLTCILQLSLGGNARTAIICTMSPALSHVEQSRNTLSFAKEVTNSAQVNMVLTGFINVLTVALEEESAIARMIKLVEDAQNQRSPMEQFIE